MSSIVPLAATTPLSSSTSSLWATTSKDWDIPAKPKPGRKPSAAVATSEGETKGRRLQNRTAQRAFRERRQSQLADLQARLKLYEQGEVERNVALQTISKKLKEENVALKRENALLRGQVKSLQENTMPNMKNLDPIPYLNTSDQGRQDPQPALVSPDSKETMAPVVTENKSTYSPSTWSTGKNFIDHGPYLPEADCFYRTNLGMHSLEQQCNDTNTTKHTISALEKNPLASGGSSILENLPAFQPAIPLKPYNTTEARTRNQLVFPVLPAVTGVASCSGDPKNCAACANDPFGQAFCEAFDVAVEAIKPCSGCPNEGCQCSNEPNDQAQPLDAVVSRDLAWKRLKSHPHAAFADLRLLAEVVAKKSNCPGPVLKTTDPELTLQVYSPTEPMDLTGPTDNIPIAVEGQEVLKHPVLVPQDVLIECGRKRMTSVREDGIREALRLLDARLI